jgi:hypothetical protein
METALDAQKSAQGHVDASDFLRDESFQQERASRAAVTAIGKSGDVELRELGDEIERELAAEPVVVHDGADFLVHELSDAQQNAPLLGVEHGLDVVEVAVDARERLLAGALAEHAVPLREIFRLHRREGLEDPSQIDLPRQREHFTEVELFRDAA